MLKLFLKVFAAAATSRRKKSPKNRKKFLDFIKSMLEMKKFTFFGGLHSKYPGFYVV
jgi:hypothetical protein